MNQTDVLKLIIEKLEQSKIDYFITGSIASSYYGIPRFTHDIDVVVNISTTRQVDDIINLFEKEGYISRDGIMEAMTGSGMFNFIHASSGFKVDFWIHRVDPFERSCFERAGKVEILEGLWANMTSPEDILLHKIIWDKITPSERQMADVRGIIAVQGEKLDTGYLIRWAKFLGIDNKILELLTDKDLPNMT